MKTIKPVLASIALTCMMFFSFGNAGCQSAGSIHTAQIDKRLTGAWQAVSSSGGLTGKGFKLDFETLILKDNGVFELMRNDSVIAHGKVSMVKDNNMNLGNFIFEKTANVQLALDPEKYLIITHTDTLNLEAPCCDRYNIKLARKR